MLGHEAFGLCGVTFFNGGKDPTVFRDVIVQPVGVGGAPGEESPSHFDEPERVQDPHELFVARGAGQRHVEVAACVVGRDPIFRAFLARDDLLKPSKVFFGPPPGREARDARFDEGPHLHAWQHSIQPQVSDPETPVGVEIHQALAGQTPQGLAYGGA
jgi:hypothetical protein